MVEDYTLIIPTYNRPKEFRALLNYLDNQSVKFNILVLDSSHPQEREENKNTISQVQLTIDVLSFPSDIPPFEKFWRGVEKVKTSFCSLCADDDVLIVNSIAPLVSFLKTNKDYIAAHGLYFSFTAKKNITISDLVYTKDVLMNDNPLIRLRDLFQSYEAITYAIYRTPILKNIFSQLQSLDSLLGRELLGGALTACMGKVKRLPLLYCGRSLAASHFYESWHPLEMLLKSPDSLYQEYGKYRKILVDNLSCLNTSYSAEDLYKLVDIIHFSYMSEFMALNILSYLNQQIMNHQTFSDIMNGLWPIIIKNQNEALPKQTEKSEKVSFLKKKFFKHKLIQEDPWLVQSECKSFEFREDFKTKIQPYLHHLEKPLKEAFIMNMNNYMAALNP